MGGSREPADRAKTPWCSEEHFIRRAPGDKAAEREDAVARQGDRGQTGDGPRKEANLAHR